MEYQNSCTTRNNLCIQPNLQSQRNKELGSLAQNTTASFFPTEPKTKKDKVEVLQSYVPKAIESDIMKKYHQNLRGDSISIMNSRSKKLMQNLKHGVKKRNISYLK